MRQPLLVLASLAVLWWGCAANPRPAAAPAEGPLPAPVEGAAAPEPGRPAVDPVVADALTDAPAGTDLTGWFCPMHADVTSDGPDKCRKCGMALVLGNPFDMRDYRLEFTTTPAAVDAGAPFTMTFAVRHPDTGSLVTDFEVVHDRRYHLFVVGQDLTSFQHIHPEQRADGSWAVEVTVPTAGYYRVLSDFLPTGGSPQFLGRSMVTADFTGDLLSEDAGVEPDETFEKTVGSITAAVEFEPEKLVAGEYGHLEFSLTDARTGEPVRDLEPYLGAFGHTLILSEDLQDYVHSHPTEGPESDVSDGHGGPRITFEGYMPRPGHYRSWSQFQRNGELTTLSFTFRVYSLAEAVR